MNSIQELIKCDWCCRPLIGYPLLLTCCHATICSYHVSDQTRKSENKNNRKLNVSTKNKKIFWCKLCEMKHDMVGKTFPQNKVVNSLLKIARNDIQSNKVYQRATRECVDLKSSMNECQSLNSKLEYYIVDQVGEIRNQIYMRRDELKAKIDEQCEMIIKRLDDYERECFANVKSKLIESKIEAIKKMNREFNAKLDEWRVCLNRFVIDEQAWETIQQKAFYANYYLENRLNELRDELLGNKFFNLKFDREFENDFHLLER